MKKFAISTLLAMQLIAPNLSFAQSNKDYSGTYLCIADASGGVRYDDASKQWVGAIFTTGDRYILTAKSNGLVEYKLYMPWVETTYISPEMTYIITWERHGANLEADSKGCLTLDDELENIEPMSSFAINGMMNCGANGAELKVNFDNLRFMLTRFEGYVQGFDIEFGNSHITIGTCTKIN